MLTNLSDQPADKILALVTQFRADPRPEKIDLGVGVYKDANGNTPVMRAVKAAEKQLWEQETSKSYVALAGDPAFADAMIGLVLGDTVAHDRIAAAATPGGTGAIRQGLELIQMASLNATVWLSNPTWPNHPSIIKYLNIPSKTYRYFDPETRSVDVQGMLADLEQVQPGDVVLVHGCCHNPTGANLNPAQWDDLIGVLKSRGAIPFVDIAYQGFGDGLTEDAALTRKIASEMGEVIVAASCSKNFGIYRERTGILMAISQDSSGTALTQKNLAFLNRQNFSFPPDHGARLVTMILNDATLRSDWETELEDVRCGMLDLRRSLADALRAETGSDRFGFLADHRGMFSRTELTADQVIKLREDHAIYMVGDSRMNIAGLNAQTIAVLAKSIAAVSA
ncbi:MAG: amino acid aminotransferase [Pseudomonadota bacterium]